MVKGYWEGFVCCICVDLTPGPHVICRLHSKPSRPCTRTRPDLSNDDILGKVTPRVVEAVREAYHINEPLPCPTGEFSDVWSDIVAPFAQPGAWLPQPRCALEDRAGLQGFMSEHEPEAL
jgi:hypothetical protein